MKWKRKIIHADSGKHVLYFDGEEYLIYSLPLLGVHKEIGSKIGTNHMISWDMTKDLLDIQAYPNIVCIWLF